MENFSPSCGSDGLMYVADALHCCVRVFSPTWNFLLKFGAQGVGDGQFGDYSPQCVVMSPSSQTHPQPLLYVSDTRNNRIQVFHTDGQFVQKWGDWGRAHSDFRKPRGLKVDVNGHLYVADTGNCRIQIFDADGAFCRLWQVVDAGEYRSIATRPFALEFDRNGCVHVLCINRREVRVFMHGKMIGTWFHGNPTDTGKILNKEPMSIVCGIDGCFYVVSRLERIVSVYNHDGCNNPTTFRLLRTIRISAAPHALPHPHAALFDHDLRLHVCCHSTICVFD